MPATAALAAGDMMPSKLVLEVPLLTAKFDGPKLIVTGALINRSGKELFVFPGYIPGKKELQTPVFFVTQENGVEVPFIFKQHPKSDTTVGKVMTKKKGPPFPGDLVVIRPGEKVEWEVDLARYYRLGAGRAFIISIDEKEVYVVDDPDHGSRWGVTILSNEIRAYR
ncbi:MAG TPA: hypothetical protein VN667_05645 [Burkholderiales bacterium]|nr:hypothetical protein [Burkholderiales bacterium]